MKPKNRDRMMSLRLNGDRISGIEEARPGPDGFRQRQEQERTAAAEMQKKSAGKIVA